MSLLEVRNLDVRFATPDGEVHAVKSMSFELARGETLGIVGESGSGKSQSVLSLLGLLAGNGTAGGRALFDGRDLLALPEAELRRIRGRRISMIFQDPMTSLNPYLRIADQMMQVVREHENVSRRAARARCLEMLTAVRIPEPEQRLDAYPHELSGGMRQRVMIAASLLLNPEILIADEPTTALDVTVQAQILALIRDLSARLGTATILITHDLAVVAGLCERVLVMHGGELKEQGEVREIFYRPKHDYTRALLAAVPRLDRARVVRPAPVKPAATDHGPLLEVEGLKVHFPVHSGRLFAKPRRLKALDGVGLTLAPGETLGVVGESGCGKSTLARAILQLVPATAGRICVMGQDLGTLEKHALRRLRRELQVIFQDPLASLNPRMTVGDIVSEPLWTHRPELDKNAVRQRVVTVLRRVGLAGRELNRYPHEFSGGQCQRIGIARALVLEPKIIICDEPVSALDVSIQAQIVDLLMDLQQELGLSLIFIAHDLAVVRQLSQRVMVMYLGTAVEIAGRDELYARPSHPYTRALINSVPIPDPDLERDRARELLSGDPPSPMNPPSGCRFRTRCRYAQQRCRDEVPELRAVAGSRVACHFAEDLPAVS
jgi:oligopeptide/dipeptide ABC transporter ATP-binding protein